MFVFKYFLQASFKFCLVFLEDYQVLLKILMPV